MSDLTHYMEATARVTRERDEARAEADRLRAALTEIAQRAICPTCPQDDQAAWSMQLIAREALEGGTE